MIAFNVAFFQFLKDQKGLKGDYGPTFMNTERETKEFFQKYQDDPHYQEMILASYLPKSLLYGYLPVAKMIYPLEETRQNLPALEERIREVPEDPRVQNKLFSFYTASSPSKETVKTLKKKSEEMPGYQLIYEEVAKIFGKQNPQPSPSPQK